MCSWWDKKSLLLCVKEMLVARLNIFTWNKVVKLKEGTNVSVWPASTELNGWKNHGRFKLPRSKTSAIKTVQIKMWAGLGEEPLTMGKSAVIYTTWQNTVGCLLSENNWVNIIFWLPEVMSHTSSELCPEVPAPVMTDGRQDAAESGQEDSFGLGTETGGLGAPWSEGMRDLLLSIRHLLQLIR